ncbi:MAG: hypothetical protein H6531_09180 [Actinobacteria bacterium]|nr:hypothetical protein [Actinomycetota bacterium]
MTAATSARSSTRPVGEIPGATLLALDSGGHPGLRQDARIPEAIDAFLD